MKRNAALVMLACLGCGEANEPVAARASPPRVLSSPAEAVDLDADPLVVHVRLRAAPALHRIGDSEYPGFAYNGQLPGPTIRARVGDTLVVELENALEFDTTLHWHGLSVPYAMDGVTWQTGAVKPGETFTYSFEVTAAGTFWYHPHFDSERQVDLGLYGALIVEAPTEPTLDDELVLIFDSWGEFRAESGSGGHGTPGTRPGALEPGLGPLHTNEHTPDPGRWTVNGLVSPAFPSRSGTSLRVRLINASNDDYLDLHWSQIRQIASDQGLLPALQTPERLLLAPGDRAEVEWLLGGDDFGIHAEPYSMHGGVALGESHELLRVETEGSRAAPPAPEWPFSGAAASSDPGSTDIVYVFTGDAGGSDWRINGERYPDVTIEELDLGSTAVLELRNASATEHPFHLHGHAFEVLAVGGVAPAVRMLEDTINVRIGEVVRLRLHADNVGDWMAHCHLLSHAEGGMMTVLRVRP